MKYIHCTIQTIKVKTIIMWHGHTDNIQIVIFRTSSFHLSLPLLFYFKKHSHFNREEYKTIINNVNVKYLFN